VKKLEPYKRLILFGENGALGGSRTPDPQIRSLMLYPAELQAHYKNKQYLKQKIRKRKPSLAVKPLASKLCGSHQLKLPAPWTRNGIIINYLWKW
jgi:hypothetical protein